MIDDHKKCCERCGTEFSKRKRDSKAQWVARKYCSVSCINKGRIVKTMMSRLMGNIEIIPESGCWIWNGALDLRGYGQIATEFGKAPIKAHRASYEFFVGEIPRGLILRHKCDVTCCINPNHLEPGTFKDNAADMVKRGRMNPISLLNLRSGKLGHLGASRLSIHATRLRSIERHPVLASINFKRVVSRIVVIEGVKHEIKGDQ